LCTLCVFVDSGPAHCRRTGPSRPRASCPRRCLGSAGLPGAGRVAVLARAAPPRPCALAGGGRRRSDAPLAPGEPGWRDGSGLAARHAGAGRPRPVAVHSTGQSAGTRAGRLSAVAAGLVPPDRTRRRRDAEHRISRQGAGCGRDRVADRDHAARRALPRRGAVERRHVGLAAGAGRAVDYLDAGRHRRDAARQAPRLARGLVRRCSADGRRAGQAAADRSPVPARPAGDHRRAGRRHIAGRGRLFRTGAAANHRGPRAGGGRSMRTVQHIVFCLCILLPCGATGADTPADYAYAWPLVTSGDSAAWQVELTPEVYAAVRDAQLRDVEVLDAAGQPVPVAPRVVQTTSIAQATDIELPQFALPVSAPGGGGDERLSLHVERGPDGKLRRLDAEVGAAEAQAAGHVSVAGGDILLDASTLKAPVDSLWLDWDPS